MAGYPQQWDWVVRSSAIERARALLPQVSAPRPAAGRLAAAAVGRGAHEAQAANAPIASAMATPPNTIGLAK